MEKIEIRADDLALEAVTGEYAVLPNRLSRHTRTLNAGIRNRLLHKSFCLETQRRKFCSYHSVEAAKHHTALLNLRKNLKSRPWRRTAIADTTPDAFAADVSHLNPVELSRFELVREIVATIPGEKVTMGEICDAMRHIGRTYTKDKNQKAVPVVPEPRQQQRSRRISPKVRGFSEDADHEHRHVTSPTNKASLDESRDEIGEVMLTKSRDSLPNHGMDTVQSVIVDTISVLSGEGTVSDSNINLLIDQVDVSEPVSKDPPYPSLFTDRTDIRRPNPVFITEVGYIPLKSRNRQLPKATNKSSRKYRPVLPFRPKLSSRTTEKGPEQANVESISSQVPQRKFPEIRKTDPYGLSYKGGRMEEPTKHNDIQKSGTEKYTLAKRVQNTKPMKYNLSSTENKINNGLTKRRKSSNTTQPEDSKLCQVKTISWKEPVASTDPSAGLKNTARLKPTGPKCHAPTAKPLKPCMKGGIPLSRHWSFVTAGEAGDATLWRANESSPLGYRIQQRKVCVIAKDGGS